MRQADLERWMRAADGPWAWDHARLLDLELSTPAPEWTRVVGNLEGLLIAWSTEESPRGGAAARALAHPAWTELNQLVRDPRTLEAYLEATRRQRRATAEAVLDRGAAFVRFERLPGGPQLLRGLAHALHLPMEEGRRRCPVGLPALPAQEPRYGLRPGSWLDRFFLVQQLGVGATAVVWDAVHILPADDSCRRVALKILKPAALAKDRQALAKLQAEARLAARLRSAHIARTWAAGVSSLGFYYLEMELLRGRTLRAELADLRLEDLRMPESAAFTMAAQLARGLDDAHNQRDPQDRPHGVVHRDLKPDNVVLCVDGQARLLDFGIAVRLGIPEEIEEGMTRGTPAYMSPEQVRGRELTPASDQFALGAVLYEALAGTRLFPGRKAREVMRLIARGSQLRPIKQLDREMPGVRPLLTRLLAPRPGSRFPTARHAAVAIDEVAARFAGPTLAHWLRERGCVEPEEGAAEVPTQTIEQQTAVQGAIPG